jgi:predicted molibdopterin-dependent oxidoreductase YjgC
MARFLKVGLTAKTLEKRLKQTIVDVSHPCFDLFPNRCVLCGKCIHVCRTHHGQSLLTFAKRGLETVLTTFIDPEHKYIPCPDCTACADICPVAAIIPKKDEPRIVYTDA